MDGTVGGLNGSSALSKTIAGEPLVSVGGGIDVTYCEAWIAGGLASGTVGGSAIEGRDTAAGRVRAMESCDGGVGGLAADRDSTLGAVDTVLNSSFCRVVGEGFSALSSATGGLIRAANALSLWLIVRSRSHRTSWVAKDDCRTTPGARYSMRLTTSNTSRSIVRSSFSNPVTQACHGGRSVGRL